MLRFIYILKTWDYTAFIVSSSYWSTRLTCLLPVCVLVNTNTLKCNSVTIFIYRPIIVVVIVIYYVLRSTEQMESCAKMHFLVSAGASPLVPHNHIPCPTSGELGSGHPTYGGRVDHHFLLLFIFYSFSFWYASGFIWCH